MKMKPVMSESESQLYIDYEAVPFKDEYTITVTKFEPIISITRYFEIDLQINIEVVMPRYVPPNCERWCKL